MAPIHWFFELQFSGWWPIGFCPAGLSIVYTEYLVSCPFCWEREINIARDRGSGDEFAYVFICTCVWQAVTPWQHCCTGLSKCHPHLRQSYPCVSDITTPKIDFVVENWCWPLKRNNLSRCITDFTDWKWNVEYKIMFHYNSWFPFPIFPITFHLFFL